MVVVNLRLVLLDKAVFTIVDLPDEVFKFIEIKFIIFIDINVFYHQVGLFSSDSGTNSLENLNDFTYWDATTTIQVEGIENFS